MTLLTIGREIEHMQGDCICDHCINEFISLYDRIALLQDIKVRMTKAMSKRQKDKVNQIIHKRIRDKTKTKKKTKRHGTKGAILKGNNNKWKARKTRLKL